MKFVKKTMKILSKKLLEELTLQTTNHLSFAESLKLQTIECLNKRLAADSWSVLECLEHLNLYGYFYLPELSKRINATTTQPDVYFKSGWLGNYFAQSMLPKEKINKMKTFKSMNPIGSTLDFKTIDVFINQQQQLLELLMKADKVSLHKTKTSISISNLIKLKLGDTFRFVSNHNERHVVQAKKVLAL